MRPGIVVQSVAPKRASTRGDRRGRNSKRGRRQRGAGQIGDVVGGDAAHRQGHRRDQSRGRARRRRDAAAAARRARRRSTRRARDIRAACARSGVAANQPSGGTGRSAAPVRRPARAAAHHRRSSTSRPSACRRPRPTLSFTSRESGKIVDAVFAEMIGADIGDDRRVRPATRRCRAARCRRAPFPEWPPARAVAHHHARAGGSGIIARRQRLIIDEIRRRCSCSRRASHAPARRRPAGAPSWSCRWSR